MTPDPEQEITPEIARHPEHIQLNSELENFRARLTLELHALELREAEIRAVLRQYAKRIKRLRTLIGVSKQQIRYGREDRVMAIYQILTEHKTLMLADICKYLTLKMGAQYGNPIAVCKVLAKHSSMFVKVEAGRYAILPALLDLNKARAAVEHANAVKSANARWHPEPKKDA